jgi:putative acetyltransferase
VIIRGEEPRDAAAVRRVNELAFGQPTEANLVEALRDSGAVLLSLVAEVEREVVGHILFSPVVIDGPNGRFGAAGLGPMAVVPERQRTGLGGRLVRSGLDRLHHARVEAVVVVGHPAYYPRFGFVPASRFGIRWEHPVSDGAFMAAELRGGALAGHAGVVRYRPEFDGV